MKQHQMALRVMAEAKDPRTKIGQVISENRFLSREMTPVVKEHSCGIGLLNLVKSIFCGFLFGDFLLMLNVVAPKKIISYMLIRCSLYIEV